jgi:hypothetical protein
MSEQPPKFDKQMREHDDSSTTREAEAFEETPTHLGSAAERLQRRHELVMRRDVLLHQRKTVVGELKSINESLVVLNERIRVLDDGLPRR